MKQVFEVVLKGFNGDSDETDHLIKWVAAQDAAQVRKYCATKGWDADRIVAIDVAIDDPGIDAQL